MKQTAINTLKKITLFVWRRFWRLRIKNKAIALVVAGAIVGELMAGITQVVGSLLSSGILELAGIILLLWFSFIFWRRDAEEAVPVVTVGGEETFASVATEFAEAVAMDGPDD